MFNPNQLDWFHPTYTRTSALGRSVPALYQADPTATVIQAALDVTSGLAWTGQPLGPRPRHAQPVLLLGTGEHVPVLLLEADAQLPTWSAALSAPTGDPGPWDWTLTVPWQGPAQTPPLPPRRPAPGPTPVPFLVPVPDDSPAVTALLAPFVARLGPRRQAPTAALPPFALPVPDAPQSFAGPLVPTAGGPPSRPRPREAPTPVPFAVPVPDEPLASLLAPAGPARPSRPVRGREGMTDPLPGEVLADFVLRDLWNQAPGRPRVPPAPPVRDPGTLPPPDAGVEPLTLWAAPPEPRPLRPRPATATAAPDQGIGWALTHFHGAGWATTPATPRPGRRLLDTPPPLAECPGGEPLILTPAPAPPVPRRRPADLPHGRTVGTPEPGLDDLAAWLVPAAPGAVRRPGPVPVPPPSPLPTANTWADVLLAWLPAGAPGAARPRPTLAPAGPDAAAEELQAGLWDATLAPTPALRTTRPRPAPPPPVPVTPLDPAGIDVLAASLAPVALPARPVRGVRTGPSPPLPDTLDAGPDVLCPTHDALTPRPRPSLRPPAPGHAGRAELDPTSADALGADVLTSTRTSTGALPPARPRPRLTGQSGREELDPAAADAVLALLGAAPDAGSLPRPRPVRSGAQAGVSLDPVTVDYLFAAIGQQAAARLAPRPRPAPVPSPTVPTAEEATAQLPHPHPPDRTPARPPVPPAAATALGARPDDVLLPTLVPGWVAAPGQRTAHPGATAAATPATPGVGPQDETPALAWLAPQPTRSVVRPVPTVAPAGPPASEDAVALGLTVTPGPYYAVAGDVFCAGAVAGQVVSE
ncbi:MAG: hypothetical protein V4597_11620 [Pseudomonadota bacterium]